MKTVLLISAHDTINNKWFYVWETPSERQISIEFNTVAEALQNRPENYICRDDAWNII